MAVKKTKAPVQLEGRGNNKGGEHVENAENHSNRVYLVQPDISDSNGPAVAGRSLGLANNMKRESVVILAVGCVVSWLAVVGLGTVIYWLWAWLG